MIIAYLHRERPCPAFSPPSSLQPGFEYWGVLPAEEAVPVARKGRTQSSTWRVECEDPKVSDGFLVRAYFCKDTTKLKGVPDTDVW